MKLKKTLRKALLNNPIAKSRRNKMRRKLENTTVTLLCPNCLGGILFHDLGLQFRSPTVNLMMYQTDFVKFILKFDEYIKGKFTFFEHPEYECPCAHLNINENEYIDIHFTHYKSNEEALKKWNERCKRINRNNMFVVLLERDGLTYEMMKELGKLDVRGLLIFTAHNYPDLPYCLYLEEFSKDGEIGNILKQNYIDGSRLYEKYFDFVEWFNNSYGKLDVSMYKRN